MGVIHEGHTTKAMTLLEPYLPPSAPADDPAAAHPAVSSTGRYAKGGSLYALGFIHGSHASGDTCGTPTRTRSIRTAPRWAWARGALARTTWP